MLPSGVVKDGLDTPLTPILNVLSLMLPKLSVALIVKILTVSTNTTEGIPVIKPVLFMVIGLKLVPIGNEPLSNVYVTLLAGD